MSSSTCSPVTNSPAPAKRPTPEQIMAVANHNGWYALCEEATKQQVLVIDLINGRLAMLGRQKGAIDRNELKRWHNYRDVFHRFDRLSKQRRSAIGDRAEVAFKILTGRDCDWGPLADRNKRLALILSLMDKYNAQ